MCLCFLGPVQTICQPSHLAEIVIDHDLLPLLENVGESVRGSSSVQFLLESSVRIAQGNLNLAILTTAKKGPERPRKANRHCACVACACMIDLQINLVNKTQNPREEDKDGMMVSPCGSQGEAGPFLLK